VVFSTHNDIDEVPVCVELRKWPEPMQCIQRHVRERLNGPLQLQIIGVEHRV
jgi:hypothetical protein